ncbi:MAG: phosphoglycerate kinase, partial [Pseudomonadota bacterium]
AHASTHGIARLLPAYVGRAMQAELEALDKALLNPQHPVIAIVGGAKVSTKLDLIGNLASKVDVLVIGGAMANTFLLAQGREVGASLVERDLLETAREMEKQAAANDCQIVLPVDAVVAREFKAGADTRTVSLDEVGPDEMILDAGPATVAVIAQHLQAAKTLVWNGPLGAFEITPFDDGTVATAREAAHLTRDGKLVSVGGGGDTVAALAAAGVTDDFTYVSTAGGAFLEWMEGKALPGVVALEDAARGKPA